MRKDMRHMFCPKCGALNDARGGRCINCGYDFGLIPNHIKERTANADAANAAENTAAEYTAENGAGAAGYTADVTADTAGYAADSAENAAAYGAADEVRAADTADAKDSVNATDTTVQSADEETTQTAGTAAQAEQPKAAEVKKPVQTYMIRAILLTVFGSAAFGIVAIIFSGMTQTELAAGSVDKAREYSEKTRMFCWISLFVGIAKYLCIGLFFLLYLVF